MAIEINIKPEDVERMVVDAILKAGLGQAVSKAVTEALGPSYKNPIDKAVQTYVLEVAGRLIREQYSAQIEESVAAVVRERITPELITKTAEAAIQKMESAARDSY